MQDLMQFAQRSLRMLAVCLLAACGGGGAVSGGGVTVAPSDPPAAAANINVLMLGNSHTEFNGLPDMLAAMVRHGRPGQTVAVEIAPDYLFLEERITHAPSLTQFASRRWQYVVLQAQKYSTSGQFVYSTAAAEEFVRKTRAQGGTAVMFPEWPRRGVDETMRIYDLHKGIAQKEGACLAPVGQAWDLALARNPALRLHADDGNHSNVAGAFLAAAVIYSTMTGEPADKLPHLAQFPVSVGDQAFLRRAAADAVAQAPPRAFCS